MSNSAPRAQIIVVKPFNCSLVLEVIFECCEKILTRIITRVKIRLLGVCSNLA